MKDLKRVLNELSDAKSNWHNIGIELGLDNCVVLESIRKDYRESTDDCFREVIVAWLKSSSQVPKTWSTLADALKAPTVGFGELATQIEKYDQPHDQPRTGKKRPHPRDESESASKQPHLEEGCNCEGLKKLLQELISKQNEKLSLLETSMKNKDARIQALEEAHKELRKELRQQCIKLEKEHLEQIQKLQNENSKNEKSQQRAAVDIRYDLCRMQEALHNVKEDWYQIGIQLPIDSQILDSIKKNNGDDSGQCLLLMLREWLTDLETNGDKGCRWCAISEALTSTVVNHDDLADTIHGHCHPKCEPYWLYEDFNPFRSK